MLTHVKSNIINNINAVHLDKDILNAALELAYSYFFSKKSICRLKIRDVYDGISIRNIIVQDNKKNNTPSPLATFLKQHIDHLQKNYSIEPNAPLLPGYFMESGEKKLQRHIRKYSIYRDFHNLKDESYKNVNKFLSDDIPDLKQRLAEIAKITGKSERVIYYSLHDKFSQRIRQKRKPKSAVSEKLLKEAETEDNYTTGHQSQPLTESKPIKIQSIMDILKEAVEEHNKISKK